jgi:hypothetical protein
MSFQSDIDFGEAVLARLHGAPALLTKPGKQLQQAVAVLDKAEKVVDAAHEGHKGATDAVAAADAALHAGVDALCDALVSAGITRREHPLLGFSKLSMSQIAELGYAKQRGAVTAIVKAVLKAKPPAAVKAAAAKCAKLVAALETSLQKRIAPDAAHAKSIRTRNTAYLGFQEALSRTRKFAGAAYADDPAAATALFAPIAAGHAHHIGVKPPATTT